MKQDLPRTLRFALLLTFVVALQDASFSQVKVASVKVNKNTTYQKITGFGGFVNSPQFTYNYMTPAEIQQLWGAASDAGYNIMRMYIPTGESNWAQTVATAQLAKSLGIKLFATSWSMPTNWKTQNVIGSQYDSSGVKKEVYLKTENYGDYARYLNNFVTLLRNNGAELDAISVQNEPDFKVDYAGCFWTPAQIVKFLKENADSITCPVMAPETVGMSDAYASALNAADVLPKFSIYGGHQYGGIGTTFKNLQAQGKQLWMTEYLINWVSGTTTRDFSWAIDGFSFADAVNNAMLANVNAWVHYAAKRYYGLIGDGTYGSTPGVITKRGRILSHYAKYITGSTRVQHIFNDVTGSLSGSAYLSATGDSVFVMVMNPSSNTYNLAVDLPFLTASGGSIKTTATEDMTQDGITFAETNRPKVTISPSSVTTLVFKKSGDFTPSQMAGEVVNYDKIEAQTPTSAAFGTAYQLSGKTAVFRSGMPLISNNTTTSNGYLSLNKRYNKLTFRVDTLTSAGSYVSGNTTLYYVNTAGATRTKLYANSAGNNYTFTGRNNFDWTLDLSDTALTDGCKGIISLTNSNAVSVLTFKFRNVFFSLGNERGYKFSGVYSPYDGNLLDVLDDTTYTSLDFTGTTGIPAQTDWNAASVNKNAVFYTPAGTLSNRTNVVAGNTCSNLVLSDTGGDFYPPTAFTATTATYQCTLNGYKMLTLPFTAGIPAGLKAYTLSFSGSQINGTLITDNTLPANTPVLVNGTGAFTFGGSGTVSPLLNPQTGIATSVYIRARVPVGSYYLATVNGTTAFARVTATVLPTLNPFDAYLSPASTQASLSISLDGVTLPVNLGSFTVKRVQNNVRLDWNTYSETANQGFDVERSADGSNYEKIGFVQGRGNSNTESWYTLTDPLPLKGLSHYRLRQIDANGAFRYYPVRTIRFDAAPSVTLYPNPGKNTLVIDGNGDEVTGTLILFDGGGRVVLRSKLNPAGKAILDISGLSPGMYFYQLNALNGTFIKQ